MVALGLVLDGDGFPRGLQARSPFPQVIKPVIIKDAGIASADNIAWLIEQGYRYLVAIDIREKS